MAGATDDGCINVRYTDSYIRARQVHPRPLTNQITPARLLAYDAAYGQMHVNAILE
ncbi:MAG: hypothetical protein H7Y11_05425 [Armatimonadetes bacterium]|nr:hypothetical protein [Anaerolineae bacterium]